MKGVIGKVLAIGVLALSNSPTLVQADTYATTGEKAYSIKTDAVKLNEPLYSDSVKLQEPSIVEKALRLALLGLPIFIGVAAFKNILVGIKKDK